MYQRGGKLHEGKASVLAGLLVLDEADVVSRQISIRRQDSHDGLHWGQGSNVPQDDRYKKTQTKINVDIHQCSRRLKMTKNVCRLPFFIVET